MGAFYSFNWANEPAKKMENRGDIKSLNIETIRRRSLEKVRTDYLTMNAFLVEIYSKLLKKIDRNHGCIPRNGIALPKSVKPLVHV
jgi:hypothetical protein